MFDWVGGAVRWCQDNRNRSNQESKFDFLATRQQLGKIDGGQQKIKIVRTNRQSNLRCSCQSIFSLCRHHPSGAEAHQGMFYLREEGIVAWVEVCGLIEGANGSGETGNHGVRLLA